MIRVEGLTFGFGRVPVLRALDLEVPEGEILGIMGPNGSGKSTLLRLMRGALVPDEGRVLFRGRPVNRYRRRELAREVAVVPQASAAPFPYPVWEAVAMGRFARRRGLGGAAEGDRAAIERALALTGTLHLAARPITELSGGELQRVVLARALAQEAPVLLLDEATSHLDIHHRLAVAELLVRLRREEGRTIVHVTHDFDLAAEISDRLLLLGPEGEALALGSPREVLTPGALHRAFAIAVRVELNPLTGAPRVTPVVRRFDPVRLPLRVHVACGGGSGGDILRRLTLAGARVTVGPLNRGDTDAELARALGARVVEEVPFAPLGPEALARAEDPAGVAPVLVLAPVPWGPGNLPLLDLARRLLEAGTPVIVVDPDEARDFTGGRAWAALQALARRGARVVADTDELVEHLSRLRPDETGVAPVH